MAINRIRLSESDKASLRESQEDMRQLEEEISRAKRAGLDTTDPEKELKKMKVLTDGLLREYS